MAGNWNRVVGGKDTLRLIRAPVSANLAMMASFGPIR